MDPILNELSIASPTNAPIDERLSGLSRVLARLAELGFARVLRTTQEALTIPLGNGLTLPGWAMQRSADRNGREARQLLMARLGRAPFVEQLLAEAEEARGRQFEARFGGQVARGLGAALLLDSVAISVPGAWAFEIDPLRVELDALDEAGVLTMTTQPVLHVYGPPHVEAQRELLRVRVLRRVESGSELWRRRTELLASLEFCARVERDLAALTGKEPWFFEICRHLAVLSDSISVWTDGAFNPTDVTWTHESKPTLDHPVYGAQREFDAPGGQRRQFSSHTKLNAVGWRIYFLPDAGTRRALIGYIGPHLDTVKFH
jgi:hypothetical protein